MTMTTKISGTRDRVLTVHGPVQQAVSIFRDVVHGVPHDAYARMEPDYGSACGPPDRSKDRKLHRAAQTRKRRAGDRDREQRGKDRAGSKRMKGQSDPMKPSARRHKQGGGKHHRN